VKPDRGKVSFQLTGKDHSESDEERTMEHIIWNTYPKKQFQEPGMHRILSSILVSLFCFLMYFGSTYS